MQLLQSRIHRIFSNRVGYTALLLFGTITTAAFFLWQQKLNALAPAPAIAAGAFGVIILLLSLTISYLNSHPQRLNHPVDRPVILGLEHLFHRWQTLHQHTNDSSILHKQLLLLQSATQEHYPTAHHLQILKYFSGSKLAGGAYLVQVDEQSPRVFKFDRNENIQKEISRYHNLVKPHLDFVAGEPFIPLQHHIAIENEDWSIIAYKFIGNEQIETRQVQTLAEYCHAHDEPEQLVTILEKIFQIMAPWWEQPYLNGDMPTLTQAPDLYSEYDRLTRYYRRIKLGIINANHQLNEPLQHAQLSSSTEYLDLTIHQQIRNPLNWIHSNLEQQKLGNWVYAPGLRRNSIVHGDFHTSNILISEHANEEQKTWVIDFPHAHLGPTIQDIARLEAEFVFGLLETAVLEQLGTIGIQQLACALLPASHQSEPSLQFLLPHPLSNSWENVAQLSKLWPSIQLLRQQASKYMNGNDARPYYLALLHATMPTLYFHDRSAWQKLFAFLASGVLCDRLGQ